MSKPKECAHQYDKGCSGRESDGKSTLIVEDRGAYLRLFAGLPEFFIKAVTVYNSAPSDSALRPPVLAPRPSVACACVVIVVPGDSVGERER